MSLGRSQQVSELKILKIINNSVPSLHSEKNIAESRENTRFTSKLSRKAERSLTQRHPAKSGKRATLREQA